MPALPRAYEVADRLLAGPYPGASGTRETRRRTALLEAAGVTLFVDLTEPGELEPYAALLERARHVRRPIADLGAAAVPQIVETLDLVDEEIAAGGSVYLHCWAGVGRTGTIVGCWLVRHGLDGGDPIARIAQLRAGIPGAGRSPETAAQQALVRGWRRGA